MYSITLIIVIGISLCSSSHANGNNGNDYYPWQKTTKSPKDEVKCGTNILKGIDLEFNGTRNVLEAEVPWQVSVQTKKDGVWVHACGGVVINKEHVLTAASCLEGNEWSGTVRAESGIVDQPKGGELRRRRQIPDYPGKDKPGLKYVQRTFAHPKYDEATRANNLAILRLATPFDVDKAEGTINDICLPVTKPMKLVETFLMTGWGALKVNATFRAKLQMIKAELEVDNCEKGKSCFVEKLLNATSDECEGDFGGPLIRYDEESKTSTLVGIYSSGDNCNSDSPSFYTPVEPHLAWIKENTKGNSWGGDWGGK